MTPDRVSGGAQPSEQPTCERIVSRQMIYEDKIALFMRNQFTAAAFEPGRNEDRNRWLPRSDFRWPISSVRIRSRS